MPKLIVTLLKANNLPASDYEMVSSGKSDPYVVFHLGQQEFRSSKQKKTVDPAWHPAERFEFDVIHVRNEVLKIEVFDEDTWNRDDLLGSIAVPVSRFEDHDDKVLTEALALDVPDNYASQNNGQASLTIEVCLKLHDSGEHVLHIWENEKYTPLSGWHPCDTDDRMQWSTHDETRTSNSFEDVAPDVPPHHEAKGWGYSTKRGDDQGWEYASTWSGPWSASSGTLTFVRRRQWENVCEPTGDQAC